MNRLKISLFIFVIFLVSQSEAHAANNAALIMRGLAKTLSAPFAIPGSMIADSSRVMFPLGIVSGAIRGSLKTVAGTLGGVFDIARGSAPYAKYAALAL